MSQARVFLGLRVAPFPSSWLPFQIALRVFPQRFLPPGAHEACSQLHRPPPPPPLLPPQFPCLPTPCLLLFKSFALYSLS